MRLLDAEERKILEFTSHIPPYAILSHVWGNDEITFEAFVAGNYSPDQSAYQKLDGCCQQAKRDGLRYVWVDTCCIDKRNSAELSEAINSMFRWYRDAVLCYAYLLDVDDCVPRTEDRDLALRNSSWFTRGRTLQELLAPKSVVLFDKSWKLIGCKEDLGSLLSDITGIPTEYLETAPLHKASVAQRMSWAAHRKTTREEDIAYCMLGIFGVSMALLYGEGSNAFLRLQEEILRHNDDQSLLAWGFGLSAESEYEKWNQGQAGWYPSAAPSSIEDVNSTYLKPGPVGVFARHPSAFAGCGQLVRCTGRPDASSVLFSAPSFGGWSISTRFQEYFSLDVLTSEHIGSSMEMTSQGLRIKLIAVNIDGKTGFQLYGLLGCQLEDDIAHVIGIPLVPCGGGYARLQFYQPFVDFPETRPHIEAPGEVRERIPYKFEGPGTAELGIKSRSKRFPPGTLGVFGLGFGPHANIEPIRVPAASLHSAKQQSSFLLRDQQIVSFKQSLRQYQRPKFVIDIPEGFPYVMRTIEPLDMWILRNRRITLSYYGIQRWDSSDETTVGCHLYFEKIEQTSSAQGPNSFVVELIMDSHRSRVTPYPGKAPGFLARIRPASDHATPNRSEPRVQLFNDVKVTLQGEEHIVRLGMAKQQQQTRLEFFLEMADTLRQIAFLRLVNCSRDCIYSLVAAGGGVLPLYLAFGMHVVAIAGVVSVAFIDLCSLEVVFYHLIWGAGLGFVFSGLSTGMKSPWFLCLHALGLSMLMTSVVLFTSLLERGKPAF